MFTNSSMVHCVVPGTQISIPRLPTRSQANEQATIAVAIGLGLVAYGLILKYMLSRS